MVSAEGADFVWRPLIKSKNGGTLNEPIKKTLMFLNMPEGRELSVFLFCEKLGFHKII